MNLRALRTLARLREVSSFQLAAAELNQTLSAVSMQMRGLEEELGVALFDRTHRPPKLTPIGRSVAERAARIVREQDALLKLAAPDGGLRGRYRIGFVLTASVRILPGFLARCREGAPEAIFNVETGLSDALLEAVARGRLDAAVVTRAERPAPSLAYRDLLSEEIVIALPPGFDATAPEQVPAELPFFHFMPQTGIGALIAEALPHCAFPPQRMITLDGVEAIVECVKMGIGYTALPEADVMRYADGALSLHPFAARPLQRRISLVTACDGPMAEMADALAALLVPGPRAGLHPREAPR